MTEAKKGGITYKSCFKTLLVKFLQADGSMAQMAQKYKQSIKCFVKESHPHFLITDGHFFIAGHFTAEAIDSFRAKNKNHPMESLKGFLINIERWSLELALVDSTKAFTSYANLELRLVIHSFSLASTTKQELENKFAHLGIQFELPSAPDAQPAPQPSSTPLDTASPSTSPAPPAPPASHSVDAPPPALPSRAPAPAPPPPSPKAPGLSDFEQFRQSQGR